MKKLKLKRPDDVDILCNDELMGKEYTLEYIKRSRWRQEDDQLKLMYRQKVDFDQLQATGANLG
jgi:polycomb group RING finger protein 3